MFNIYFLKALFNTQSRNDERSSAYVFTLLGTWIIFF